MIMLMSRLPGWLACLCLTCVLLLPSSHAQQLKVDSLESSLRRQKADSTRVGTLLALATAYSYSNVRRAIEYGEQALALSATLPSKTLLARVLTEFGRLQADQRLFADAQRNLDRGLRIARESNSGVVIARALIALAVIQKFLGRLDSAQVLCSQALSAATRTGDTASMASARLDIGTMHFMAGAFPPALENHRHALALARRIGDRRTETNALIGIGLSAFRLGRNDEAMESFNTAYELAGRGGDKIAMSSALGNLGNLHLRLGHTDKALEQYQRALKLQEEIGRKETIANSLGNIGLIHSGQGRYEQAMQYFQRTLALQEEIGDKPGTGSTLQNIGGIHAAQGRNQQAMEYYRRSLKIREESGDKRGAAFTLGSIGQIHASQGRYDSALGYYLRSLKLREEMGNKAGISSALLLVGTVHSHEGRLDQALVHFQRSLTLREEIGDKAGIATAVLNIAETRLLQGENDSAITSALHAHAIAQDIGDVKTLREASKLIGQAYARKTDFANAYRFHVEYATLSDSLVNEANLRSINEMSAKYESVQREQRIVLLEKDRSLQELELKRQQEEILRQQLEAQQKAQLLELMDKARLLQKLELEKNTVEIERQRIEDRRKKNAIDLLGKDKQLQATLLERETLIRNVSIAGMGVILVLTIGLYNRYRFKKRTAEQLAHANSRLSTTLDELQRTQSQLIHAEKMATLGELTAGIAHEIRNPLNFVNNFSKLSSEIVDELEQMLRDASMGDVVKNRATIIEFLADLRANTDRIAEHGIRANAIVSGMMMHARGSSGVRLSVDINELTDQSLRLLAGSQPGADDIAPVAITTAYDPDAGQVDVIPQELGRVLLNLLGNALYAVRDRSKRETRDVARMAAMPGFRPAISVSTIRRDDAVEIRIRDNGTGIPAEIRDKIFQPFFTTKPTGEGTGLGLSMSYDIVVKGHGGVLDFVSDADGAEFIITLPVAAHPKPPDAAG